jgi:hypothetical protein
VGAHFSRKNDLQTGKLLQRFEILITNHVHVAIGDQNVLSAVPDAEQSAISFGQRLLDVRRCHIGMGESTQAIADSASPRPFVCW